MSHAPEKIMNTSDRSENPAAPCVGSGDLLGVWEYFSDPCYYDMYAVRPVGEKRWGHCFHLVNHDEAKGLAELLTKLSLPGRSGTHDVQQETGSVGTGGDFFSPNTKAEPRRGGTKLTT